MKKILHISDIHASIHPTKGQAGHVLKLLKEAFLKDSSIYEEADSIIVSGDLTYSGDEKEYELFDSEIITPIKAHLNLSNDQIFFAPGNHDTRRAGFTYSQKKAVLSLRDKYDASEVGMLQKEIFADLPNPCDGWNRYSANFYKDSSAVVELGELYQVYRHGDVGIACLNTGWSAIGEGDREKLFIGESQVLKALKAIKPYKDKVIVLHHPFDWLHPEERKMLAQHIRNNGVSAVFYGHMHEFNVLRESSFSDDFVMKLQAGRFDLSGSGKSGYSFVSLNHSNNLKCGRIYFRRFDKDSESFVPWIDRCPNGQIDYESIPAQGFNRESFAEDCDTILERYDFELMCNTGVADKERKRLTDIFICPAMKISGYDIEEQAEEKYIELEEIDRSRDSFVIVGGENSGKSTILKRLLINKLRDQSRLHLDEIVFYFDCRGKKVPSKHRLKADLAEIYESAPNADLYMDILKVKTTTENALIVLDGLDDLSAHCLDQVLEFLKEFKGPRFIVACKHAAAQDLMTKLRTVSERDFVEVSIGGMKRSHLKGLIGKWLADEKEKNSVTREVLKAVENAGMPNNLFVYSMLLSIYERKQGNFSTYLHEADLVENFIEVIMHKHCVSSQRAPQYKDLLRLLGSVAENMVKEDCYSLTCARFDSIIVKFNTDIAQDFSVSSYLNPILASGVIELIDGSYRFSQACFFDYAYARYLSTQKNTYKELNGQLNFLRFNKVIEYLSAISKSDVDLLDFCKELTEHAWLACVDSENMNDLKTAEEEMEAAAKSDIDILDQVKDEVIDATLEHEPPKEHEIVEQLDNSSPLRITAQNGGDRATWNGLSGVTLFLSSLSLYARAFRAAEHLTDRESADRHFEAAMDFYGKTIALSTRKFHEQLRPVVIDKLVKHSGYEQLKEVEQKRMLDNFNAFLNFFVAAFPNFTVSMMTSDLINARQISRLRQKRDQTTRNLEKIIISYSLCELDEIDTLAEIKSLEPQKSFEYTSVIMKIVELSHMDFTLSEETRKDLMKHAHALMKDRKARKLVKDMSKISSKITEGLLDETS